MSAVSFLICDPSPALQTFSQQLLASYGFDAASIKTAGNPQAATEIAASLHPDLLLTDWFAKESLSGIALYRAILASSPGCRLALLTRTHGPDQMDEAREAGALFLLAKPFTADALRGEVAKALDVLARTHPAIAQRVSAQALATAQPRAAVQIQLPRLPQYKPGDRVLYQNRTESVKNVILRRGELVVQLDGVPGMVEASKITRL
jgi:DNA-binding NtrC family response regulator